MNLSINLGAWNSLFAIPCDVVDKHIKLAGSAQLKVLLFILRHAGEKISTVEIANALSMSEIDVKDSMQYWLETNIISRDSLTNFDENFTVRKEASDSNSICVIDKSEFNGNLNKLNDKYMKGEL